MINKLVYPKYFDVTPCTVNLTMQGRNGEEIKETWTGKCNFSETSKRVQNKDGLWIHLSGVCHMCGDIFPSEEIIEGFVVINNRKMTIMNAARKRNPDGSINHTRLELL